jgi:hypothetical protein
LTSGGRRRKSALHVLLIAWMVPMNRPKDTSRVLNSETRRAWKPHWSPAPMRNINGAVSTTVTIGSKPKVVASSKVR